MNSIFLHTLAILNNSLESDYGKALYAQCKIDVETIFDRLKGAFGMRRTHVRGKNVAPTDIGMMLMSMNLTKLSLEARRKAEAFQHKSVKNKKNATKQSHL
ncbi:transposase [Pediococcus acidilactici]|nr:transposase [Pediococcus acidilactici]